jgi:hypothetical protein
LANEAAARAITWSAGWPLGPRRWIISRYPRDDAVVIDLHCVLRRGRNDRRGAWCYDLTGSLRKTPVGGPSFARYIDVGDALDGRDVIPERRISHAMGSLALGGCSSRYGAASPFRLGNDQQFSATCGPSRFAADQARGRVDLRRRLAGHRSSARHPR